METDRLAELIGCKHAVLEQLRELSRRQPELIGQGDMTRLLAVLSAKQTLLAQLQQVERQLDPYRDQDPDSRQWRSPEHRLRTRQVAERCEALLREVMLIEKQSETDLSVRRDEAASRLQGMHVAAEAHQAYSSASAPAASQLDLTSES